MYDLAISEEMQKFEKLTTDIKIKTIEYSLIRNGEYSCVEERLDYEAQGYRILTEEETKHRKYLTITPFLLSIPSAIFLLIFGTFFND